MEWFAAGVSVLMMGLEKGGFPVGALATPFLILLWSNQQTAAKEVLGFLLPVMCLADVLAFLIYRREIQWKLLRPLLPAAVCAVAVSSWFVLPDDGIRAFVVPERWVKGVVGAAGLVFIAVKLFKAKLRQGVFAQETGFMRNLYGAAIGVVSVMSHSAGPLMQMYLLPKKLTNLQFAGTGVGMFFIVNWLKLIPYAALGRVTVESTVRSLFYLPLIPLGFWGGWFLVKRLRPEIYQGVIYAALFLTSVSLLWKACL